MDIFLKGKYYPVGSELETPDGKFIKVTKARRGCENCIYHKDKDCNCLEMCCMATKRKDRKAVTFNSFVPKRLAEQNGPNGQYQPMMCYDELRGWILRYYYGVLKGRHIVVREKSLAPRPGNFTYIIPFNKFDPENPEESKKYNINK